MSLLYEWCFGNSESGPVSGINWEGQRKTIMARSKVTSHQSSPYAIVPVVRGESVPRGVASKRCTKCCKQLFPALFGAIPSS